MSRGNLFLQSVLALSLLSIAAACLNECCPRDPVRCHAWGDPHYTTFDGLTYDFQGKCEYVLARPCVLPEGAPDWSVLGSNVPCNADKTCTNTITVNVYGLQFILFNDNTIKILPDGDATLPYCLKNQVSVAIGSNGKLVLQTDFGLTVTFGGNTFDIELPRGAYKDNTCGLCGLVDGSPKNDFFLPNGIVASDADTFGNAWQADPDSCKGRETRELKEVAAAAAITPEDAKKLCEASLINDVLGRCNELVDPAAYIDACITDVTASGDRSQICATLERYAAACRLNGLVLDWRRRDLCGMLCPDGMIYKINGPTFVPTCQDPTGDTECCNPPTDGCFCPDGRVLYDGKCVDPKECGCDWEGRHFTIGQTWMQDFCTLQCTCLPTHEVVCTQIACHKDAFCFKHYDGLHSCMCNKGTKGDGIRFCNPI